MSNSTSQSGNDYLKACSSTRWAKNLFLLVIILALLVHIASYILCVYAKEFGTDTQKTIFVDVMPTALALAKALGLVAGLLLTMTMKFAVGISLTDRLGGAISNFPEMTTQMLKNGIIGQGPKAETKDLVFHYLRFLAYPSIMLLIAIAVQFKFSRGYKNCCTTNVE